MKENLEIKDNAKRVNESQNKSSSYNSDSADNKQVKDKYGELVNNNDINKNIPLNKFSNLFLIFSIISVVYFVTFSISGFIVYIPALFLWVIWLCIILIASLLTIGAIWFSNGFRSFNDSFVGFNKWVGSSSGAVANIIYNSLPFCSVLFMVFQISFLITAIIGTAKKQRGYIGRLVAAIMIVFISLFSICFDFYFINL